MNEAHTSLEEHTEGQYRGFHIVCWHEGAEEARGDAEGYTNKDGYTSILSACYGVWWYSSPSFNSDINL